MKAMLTLAALVVPAMVAWADAPAQPAILPGGGITPLIPMILIFGIFYFLMIRPQQKKAKVHERFLTDLKKGDMVVTNAGIVGTIKSLGDKLVSLEVDEGVVLKILRAQVSESASVLKEDPKPKPA